MFKSENILCNPVRIWLEQYQLLFYITNLQPMGSHHATLNFKDSHDWVITKKKIKKFDGRKRREKFLTFPSCILYWEKVNEYYAIFGLWKKWTQKGAPAKVCIQSFNLHLILLCCNDVCMKFTKLLILLKNNHLKFWF